MVMNEQNSKLHLEKDKDKKDKEEKKAEEDKKKDQEKKVVPFSTIKGFSACLGDQD